MKFLDGEATTKAIVRLMNSSRQIRMAVAFWGLGAMNGLHLKGRANTAKIICNLKSGGTNPREIQKLIDENIPVLQCDDLHGKVYLFDEHVIIGSSNASANGLALQGNEVAGWREANILTTERSVYEAAERWFQKLAARAITGPDVIAAQAEFDKRRAAATIRATALTSLVEAVRANPDTFRDRRIYICVYRELFGPLEIKQLKQARAQAQDPRVDALGWKVPVNARLLCFYHRPRGGIAFHGFWDRQRTEWKSGGKSPLYFMRKLRDLDGLSADGLPDDWAEALAAFSKAEIGAETAKHIELGAFYDKYLSRTKTKMKVLNVLDKIGRVKGVGGIIYESGFWFRPDRGCHVIRVFQDDGGTSVRGGRILKMQDRVRKGAKTKVILFEDDASQHGKPPPPRFRQNGCAATLE